MLYSSKSCVFLYYFKGSQNECHCQRSREDGSACKEPSHMSTCVDDDDDDDEGLVLYMAPNPTERFKCLPPA